MTDPPWKKPSQGMYHGSVKGRSKSYAAASSVRKFLAYAQDNTRRDNNPDLPALIAPAPAHKAPVCQVPVTPNVKDIDKVRQIALSAIIVN